jgi:hypothetical protein
MYTFPATAGHIDTVGPMRVCFLDLSVCLPFWEDFNVLSEQAYDAKYEGMGSFIGQVAAVTADTPITGVTRITLADPGLSAVGDDQMSGSFLYILDRDTREVLGVRAAGDWTDASNYIFVDDYDFVVTTGMDYLLAWAPPGILLSGPVASANIAQLGGSVQSVTDLKDFVDAGYDPATHKVQGLVLADTCTTNTDMRGTDNAALASVLGALADAAAAGDPTSADTVVQYLKQIINTLEGAAGIPSFPAESAPGNDVSLAEIIRAIHADVTGLNGSAIPTANENADALLDRNIAGGSSTGRTVTQALRALRNKVAIVAGTMTVYFEDDSTPSWTAAVVTTAGNPISSVDPA